MSEIDEIGQALGRTGAAVLSAALITARIAMQRRAELADKARREGELRQQQVARQLNADRELAAVSWQRLNVRQWFRESPREVAQVWASAAVWAPHDPRALEAFESLNSQLDRLGTVEPDVSAAMRESGDYEGLAVLLARGAAEARSEAERAAGQRDTEGRGIGERGPQDQGQEQEASGGPLLFEQPAREPYPARDLLYDTFPVRHAERMFASPGWPALEENIDRWWAEGVPVDELLRKDAWRATAAPRQDPGSYLDGALGGEVEKYRTGNWGAAAAARTERGTTETRSAAAQPAAAAEPQVARSAYPAREMVYDVFPDTIADRMVAAPGWPALEENIDRWWAQGAPVDEMIRQSGMRGLGQMQDPTWYVSGQLQRAVEQAQPAGRAESATSGAGDTGLGAAEQSDPTGPTVPDAGMADERGQIYLDGEDPARLAGMGFASSTHDAVARAAERAAERPGAPRSGPRRTPKVHRGDERGR